MPQQGSLRATRMELMQFKARLKTATRGHKLLKDKQDGLIRTFLDLVKRNQELRQEVDNELVKALKNFLMARSVMSPEVIDESLIYPTRSIDIEVTTHNIMSVDVPRIALKEEKNSNGIPYGLATTSAELDDAIKVMGETLPKLLELAEIEKTCQLLADEIEKTRRRVNALEYVMIPQLEENIRYINMKLEENERANTARLMKVKEIIAK